MERDYTTYLIEKARSKHTARLLEYLLEIHDAFVQGVTAHEATEWLELPPGRASETAVGIMLRTLGYKRYRRRTKSAEGWVQEHRLFMRDTPPEGWTR